VTSFVLDASIAFAWCFDNEGTEAADRLLEQLRSDQAAVPSLWHLEVSNGLALAERRGRITRADTVRFIDLLESLTIVVDADTPRLAFGSILDLARSQRLTGYDASYLELAMRLGIPLATKDSALAGAAQRLGVAVVGTDP
jgi:predicted nucleic acid-binding protein